MCPSSKYEDEKKRHWHVLAIFKSGSKKKMNQLKTMLDDQTAHIEKVADVAAYKKYCSKDKDKHKNTVTIEKDSRFEYGTFREKNDRTIVRADKGTPHQQMEYIESLRLINEGKEILEIIEEQPKVGFQHLSNLCRIKSMVDYKKLKPREVKVQVIIGVSQSGKSHYVQNKYPGLYRVMPPNGNGNQRIDNYQGEKVIFFDEFNYGRFTKQALLDILDGNKTYFQCKGGTIVPQRTDVIIVSNFHPDRWYRDYKDGIMIKEDFVVESDALLPKPAGSKDTLGPALRNRLFKFNDLIIITKQHPLAPAANRIYGSQKFESIEDMINNKKEAPIKIGYEILNNDPNVVIGGNPNPLPPPPPPLKVVEHHTEKDIHQFKTLRELGCKPPQQETLKQYLDDHIKAGTIISIDDTDLALKVISDEDEKKTTIVPDDDEEEDIIITNGGNHTIECTKVSPQTHEEDGEMSNKNFIPGSTIRELFDDEHQQEEFEIEGQGNPYRK
jgi:hypothetical protein